MMRTLAVIAVSLAVCFCEPYFGTCPDITGKIVDVPDLSAYMGKWYEIQKFTNFFERGLECNYAEYTLMSDSSGEMEKSANVSKLTSVTGRKCVKIVFEII